MQVGTYSITAKAYDSQGATAVTAPVTVTVVRKFAVVDFDGDGKTDMAVWTPTTGLWRIIPSFTGTSYTVSYGATGDIPVSGDFDGDGKTDIFWYRGAN